MLQNLILKPSVAHTPHSNLSLNILGVDELFPGFVLGDFAVLYGSRSVISLTSLLCVRTQLPQQLGGLESTVVFIDGGNTFRLYNIVRLAQLYQLDTQKVLGHIFISRAFTVYQLTSLIMAQLEETVKTYNAKVVVISDIAGFFLDIGVPAEEAQRIYSQITAYLSNLANKHQIIIVARIPDLDYHICTRRVGMVPKTVDLALTKRLIYKSLRDETTDKVKKQIYDKRQTALKWILVTCFGYLGFSNSKFGTVDGHIGVCAFARESFLKAVHLAEEQGFEVVHGIVDSLWLKKTGASIDDYSRLCNLLTTEIGIPIHFEGHYTWIAFLPSRLHPRLSVLNRYMGVMDNGKIKVRGLEVRRRDTPDYVFDAQTEMINILAKAGNTAELYKQIPEVLKVLRLYRQRLLDGEVPLSDLIVTKHMSKQPHHYRQQVSQVIAAQQLGKHGLDMTAGSHVRFLYTDANHKHVSHRVKAAQLIDRGINPDTKKYLLLLYSSGANLLSFAGYTTETVYDAVRGQQQSLLK